MLLNTTSKVLGKIPADPGCVPPWTVYVFPEFADAIRKQQCILAMEEVADEWQGRFGEEVGLEVVAGGKMWENV